MACGEEQPVWRIICSFPFFVQVGELEGLCVQESRQLYGCPGDAGMAAGMCLRSRVKVREAKSRIRLITRSLCDKGEAHGHSAWCPRESVAPANTCSSCCYVDTDVFGKH